MIRETIKTAALKLKKRIVMEYGAEVAVSLFGSTARGDYYEFNFDDHVKCRVSHKATKSQRIKIFYFQ